MGRILFEFEDKSWFPDYLRTYMTDYLQLLFNSLNLYSPALPIIHSVVKETGKRDLVDLCSGSGGPLPRIATDFKKHFNMPLNITLTDKYPSNHLNINLPNNIKYELTPLDAEKIPQHVKGIRTMFSGLHHFNKAQVLNIINNSTKSHQPIAFFDGGGNRVAMILMIVVLHPLFILLLTPFIKPFTIKRLFFTYLIPLVIVFTVWDGVVSILNLYTPKYLKKLIDRAEFSDYNWIIGSLYNKFGMKIVFIKGISKKHYVGII